MAKKDAEIKAEIVSSEFPKFDFDLTVLYPFLQYVRGDRIVEDAEIQFVIDQGYLPKCVKTKHQ